MKMKYLFVIAIAATILYGCGSTGPTIAGYDGYAYLQTTSLKVDALNLMDSATRDYQSQVKNIVTVNSNLQKIYTYEKNRPKNDLSATQYKILLDTTGHLFGGFIKRWRDEKKLGKAFVDDEKKLVSDAFDQIAELESKKIKQPTNQ